MANIRSDGASVPYLTLEDIDVTEFKDAFCLNILVCGKTGVGKSSLINNLVGSEVCKVNDPGLEGGSLDRGTTEVNEINVTIDKVFVTIYDSPGLQDGTPDEQRYLQDMHDKCNDVNLVLYCMEMPASRFTDAEVRATELITNKFGPEFWNRCVLVMTKANMVRIPPREKGKEREYHERLYNNFMKKFHDQLVEQGVSTAIVNQLPGVAAGIIQPEDDEERYIWYPSNKAKPSERPVDFLSELWLTCFDRTASESQAKFLRATTRQRDKPLPVASEIEENFKKQLEESKQQMEELTRKLRKKYEQEIEQIKQNHVYRPPYQPAPRGPNTGRATAGAMTGAAAGAMVAGPPGALFGAIFGWLLGV
jgi:tRNA U34 5-carboxymethylaminomethyl modifying GTPase MnmE/TrmE